MSDMFLTKEEVVELTGWKNKKKQVEQLRKMGLPFWVNARRCCETCIMHAITIASKQITCLSRATPCPMQNGP